eukprot:COSAG02_NODE_904_length_16045_cov_3920.854697_17_plen_188_part_00
MKIRACCSIDINVICALCCLPGPIFWAHRIRCALRTKTTLIRGVVAYSYCRSVADTTAVSKVHGRFCPIGAYCACLGFPHFHWLISAPNLAVSSITARLCTSIEFAVIPKGAQHARIRNTFLFIHQSEPMHSGAWWGSGRTVHIQWILTSRIPTILLLQKVLLRQSADILVSPTWTCTTCTLLPGST